ncbi:unnamed protein product [Meloidogyne enterolobii]|uniref:Uncharacterized protein n=1 Tax=Meloidogyne enterolobii TaxID=390850 RepID=A0ACB1ABK3_MELEN
MTYVTSRTFTTGTLHYIPDIFNLTCCTITNCFNCNQKTIGLEQQFLNNIFTRYKEIQTVKKRKWRQERLVS